jgi:hypothetical protein
MQDQSTITTHSATHAESVSCYNVRVDFRNGAHDCYSVDVLELDQPHEREAVEYALIQADKDHPHNVIQDAYVTATILN